MTPDRIEKKILLHAPLGRVWQAIADSRQFGTWFGVAFDGPFVAGARLSGRMVPTRVDPEVAKLQEPHEGKTFECYVDRIEPMWSIAFWWRHYDIEPDVDYTKEPTTLIAFELEDVGGSVSLTIAESGFDQIPMERRAKAFAANEGGWAMQTRLIEKYLAAHGTT